MHCPGFSVSKFLSNRNASDDHIPHLGWLKHLAVQRTLKIDFFFFLFFFGGTWQNIRCVKDWASSSAQCSLNCAIGFPFGLFGKQRQHFFPSDHLLLLRPMFFSLPVDSHWADSFLLHYLGIECIILRAKLEPKNSLAHTESGNS